MPIVLAGFCLLPFLIALIAMYLLCLKTKRWYLRAIPPAVVVLVAALVTLGRYRVWSSTTVAPWTQLLFFPGLPALFLFLGLLTGWRLWRRRWLPRVVNDRKRR